MVSCFFNIYLLTVIGLSPSGSTVHIYIQTMNRMTQNKQYIEKPRILDKCGLCPVFASDTEAFALRLRNKHKNPAMYTIHHDLARLYNCKETGIYIVEHQHLKILGSKGNCQVSSVQTAAHGSLVTVVKCMRPTGHFIPLLLVFPRKCRKPEVMNGKLPGSIHACHPSGRIEREIFTQWFIHFIKHTKPTE